MISEVVSKGTIRGLPVQRVFKGDLEGDSQRGLQTGLGRGLVVKLRSGLVQVWFSLQLKFNSLELNTEVGICFSMLSTKFNMYIC